MERTTLHKGFLVTVAVGALLLAGCGNAAQSLTDPAKQALASVRSESQGFDLRAQGRLTANALQILVKDMTDQIMSAEKSAEKVKASQSGDPALRETTLAALRQAASASFAARDCLDLKQSCTAAIAALGRADQALDQTVTRLEAVR